ncbi:MAG: glycosyl hydrolase family 18 protein [Solirubrobacteraceae bacterium]
MPLTHRYDQAVRITAASLLSAAVLALSASSAQARLTVIGFQPEETPLQAIAHSRAALTTVAVDGVNLEGSGNAVTMPGPATLRQLATAHRDGLPAVLVVGNFDPAMEDFSEPLAHRLLGNPAAIAAVAGMLATAVATEGWDGVNVDLESLLPRDAAGLTNFLGSLRVALGPTARLSIDISNATDAAQFAAQGYDLPALGNEVNTVVLMGYDQHGPWEATPGPVGALWWQRAGLAIVTRQMAPSKVVLGVAGYGYAWRPHARHMISDAQARALVRSHHARARYMPALGEWTARLSDGSTLWWSDRRSFRRRLSLARADHIQGLAVWSLGLTDPLTSQGQVRGRQRWRVTARAVQ